MATTALLAQQPAKSQDDDPYKPILQNSTNQGRTEISPSFTVTAVPEKNVEGGGPLTFEPNSVSGVNHLNKGAGMEMSFN